MERRMVSSNESSVKHVSINDIGPSRAQTTAAEVSIYLKSMQVLKAAARTRARSEHPFWGRGKYRRELKRELTNMYVSSVTSSHDKQLRTAPTYEEMGTPKAAAKVIYEETAPQLDAIETETLAKASELGRLKRAKIAVETISIINRLPENQSEELLRRAGYSKEKTVFIRGKMATSAVLGTITGGIAFVGVNGAAFAEGVHPVIQNITDSKMLLSYLAFYGSTFLAAWSNKPLLDEPTIKTSANLFPTIGYYVLPKFFSEKAKKWGERIGVGAGTYGPNLWGELTTWGIIGSFAGLQGVMGRNLASTAAELATVAGNLTWLSIARKRANHSQ